MNAFFSATDFDEIKGNAENYNYYVSLVVSFDEKYVCKIAFPTTQKYTREFKIRDDSGEIMTSSVTQENTVVILSNLEIEFEYENLLESWFIDKHAKLVQENKNKITTVSKTTNKVDYGYGYGYNYRNGNTAYTDADDDIDYNDWRNWKNPSGKSGVNNTPGVKTRYIAPEVDAVEASSFEATFNATQQDELELSDIDKFLYLIVADTNGMATPNNGKVDTIEEIEYDFYPAELLIEMDDWTKEDFDYFEQVLDADLIYAYEIIYSDEDVNAPRLIQRVKEVIDYIPQLHNSRNAKKLVNILKKFVKTYDEV